MPAGSFLLPRSNANWPSASPGPMARALMRGALLIPATCLVKQTTCGRPSGLPVPTPLAGDLRASVAWVAMGPHSPGS
ncbi:hypothetical protein MPEAHAMD_7103 [Methylobacterium frigidaeris]|uniref:Uncharacterized protein n=1 Tax=Methylobacterium frigidaeris TaxID=2038277 RepID=A0AA37HJT1_9HYPH|nr:hypothetical protein MPEAHAMD_7103 [Methylobacterium frigidaeris]